MDRLSGAVDADPLWVDVAAPPITVISDELERRWAGESGALGDMCRYALVPTGKLFRPLLLLDSALAVGGTLSAVLPAAVGAECGHVASLIHDDIIDHDDLRRGRPSVQYRYGVPDAIIAGDALIFDLFASLAECRTTGVPDSRVVSALEAVARAGVDLCRGQTLEAELSRSLLIDQDSYLRMISLKTAAYFRAACESGAILGGGPQESVEALRGYGELLGLAFQIQDDLLPYTSDSRTTGKPDTSDVKNGRLTLPVILAYQAATEPERDLVRECLSGQVDATRTLAYFRDLLHRTGAIVAAQDMAHRCAGDSRRALDLLAPSPSRDRLGHLANLVLTRRR